MSESLYDSDSSNESDDSIDSTIDNFELSILIKREEIMYNENQYGDINDDQTIINAEMNKLRRNGTSIIYQNQE